MVLAQIQSNSLLEYIALVLSVVSVLVTTLGFLASLKFYRDGMALQANANDALTKIEEKTQFIQTQVGGMFDKTLDAAIGKKELMTANFEEINEQLEKAKTKLIEESIKEIGVAGEQERKRLTGIVDKEMKLIRNKVETTREAAEEIADANKNPVMIEVRLILEIFDFLEKNDGAATWPDISKHLKRTPAEIATAINWFIGHGWGTIATDGRFHLLPKGIKNIETIKR